MSSDLKKLNLGQKVRSLRESLGKTIEEFASEVGLGTSLLKKIEINEIFPPIATLLNMGHHCGVELGYFLSESQKDKPFTVIKKGKEKKIKRVFPKGKNPLSYSYKTLASGKLKKRMEPFLVEFSPVREKVPQVAHDGEEFLFVLDGKIEGRLNRKKVILSSGDALYFESKYPHAFKAVGGKKARAIVVLYPH